MEKFIPYEELQKQIVQLSHHFVKIASEKGIKVSTAESCTGGMISAAITAVSGSSSVIEMGACTYSNRIKQELLGVDAEIIDTHTEYSVECAEAMAKGIMKLADADIGVSTTGVAGPTGGSEEHPVGEVCIAVCALADSTRKTHSKRYIFPAHNGDGFSARDYIRAAATRKALLLIDLMLATI